MLFIAGIRKPTPKSGLNALNLIVLEVFTRLFREINDSSDRSDKLVLRHILR